MLGDVWVFHRIIVAAYRHTVFANVMVYKSAGAKHAKGNGCGSEWYHMDL